MRDEWKCVLTTPGEPSATTAGKAATRALFASSLGTLTAVVSKHNAGPLAVNLYSMHALGILQCANNRPPFSLYLQDEMECIIPVNVTRGMVFAVRSKRSKMNFTTRAVALALYEARYTFKDILHQIAFTREIQEKMSLCYEIPGHVA